MKKCLAFVLGGGGARGAMQVGAIRALLEAGVRPDLLVGTSIGAANAAALALWGLDAAGLQRLEQVYENMASSGIMDPQLTLFILTSLSKRPNLRGSRRIRDFLISEGLVPDLLFKRLRDVQLAVVGADLHTGEPVIFGRDPEQSVLDGVLASTAIPPWFAPLDLGDGRFVIDGGAVSNLPIEAAVELGATRIIALDHNEPGDSSATDYSPTWYLGKLANASCQRVTALELALARSRGVTVHHISLRSSPSVPIWDFTSHRRLLQVGYELALKQSQQWQEAARDQSNKPLLRQAVDSVRRRFRRAREMNTSSQIKGQRGAQS